MTFPSDIQVLLITRNLLEASPSNSNGLLGWVRSPLLGINVLLGGYKTRGMGISYPLPERNE